MIRRRRGIERYVRRRVIVHTKDGHSFRGFVERGDRAGIELAHAERLTAVPGTNGEVRAEPLTDAPPWIPDSNVSLVQVLASPVDAPAVAPAAAPRADRVIELVPEPVAGGAS